jgi:two-component system CheB/CheR fusion protein
MVIAEVIGIEQFQARVKIYGTDIDAEALNEARLASYTERQMAGVPPALIEKYFERAGERFVFRKELRRSVIFGRHDLIQDAPISRVDLLSCRNALMYFNAETQSRVLERFHFAVSDNGYLFLGKAEMLLTNSATFQPVDLKRRVFTKVARPARERTWVLPRTNGDAANGHGNHIRLRDLVFETGPLPRVAIDANGFLALANQAARSLFGLTPKDLGRPLQDLELSYKPVELRSLIEQVSGEGQPRAIKGVEWRKPGGDAAFFDVLVEPLLSGQDSVLGVSISFLETTVQRSLEKELQRANRDLAAASEELQSTNEELETTNEELQSTVEELETTNEELQSTNEELETMNEELQSANEELQAINEELRQRSDELSRTSHFTQAVLAGIRSGVVVLDRDLLVLTWNNRAEDLWGLRPEEVLGRPFLNLDIGLPVDQIKPPIKLCLNGDKGPRQIRLEAVNRRGRSFVCLVTCTPLLGSDHQAGGVILLMEDEAPLQAVAAPGGGT